MCHPPNQLIIDFPLDFMRLLTKEEQFLGMMLFSVQMSEQDAAWLILKVYDRSFS